MNDGIRLNLYRGKVIDIDDTDMQGKIQVQLLPEMNSISTSDCPWFEPFVGNSSTSELSFNSPEVDSLIWMLADDKFYHRYYLPFKYNITGTIDFTDVSTLLSSLVDIDTSYKNIQFTLYEDQSLSFHNRSDGSHGFIQSTGSYTYFDKNGKINVNSVDELEIATTSDVTVTSSGLVTVDGASGIELNGNTYGLTMYTQLNTALQAHITKYNADMALILAGATASIAASGLWISPLTGLGITTLDLSSAQTTTVTTGG